jgi:hypothetical protein
VAGREDPRIYVLRKGVRLCPLGKQNTTKSLSSRRREYVSGRDRTSTAQKYNLIVGPTPFRPGAPPDGPFPFEIIAGDFAFATGHRSINGVAANARTV